MTDNSNSGQSHPDQSSAYVHPSYQQWPGYTNGYYQQPPSSSTAGDQQNGSTYSAAAQVYSYPQNGYYPYAVPYGHPPAEGDTQQQQQAANSYYGATGQSSLTGYYPPQPTGSDAGYGTAPPQAPPSGGTIKITGFPKGTGIDELRSSFAIGAIRKDPTTGGELVKFSADGLSLNVTYEDSSVADAAVVMLNESNFGSAKLTVTLESQPAGSSGVKRKAEEAPPAAQAQPPAQADPYAAYNYYGYPYGGYPPQPQDPNMAYGAAPGYGYPAYGPGYGQAPPDYYNARPPAYGAPAGPPPYRPPPPNQNGGPGPRAAFNKRPRMEFNSAAANQSTPAEGTWLCKLCNEGNLPFHSECNKCRAPKPTNAKASFTGAPRRGEDWICKSCQNVNFAARIQCNRCKLPKGMEPSPNLGFSPPPQKQEEWICAQCQNNNWSFRTKCNRCSADKPSAGGSSSTGPNKEKLMEVLNKLNACAPKSQQQPQFQNSQPKFSSGGGAPPFATGANSAPIVNSKLSRFSDHK